MRHALTLLDRILLPNSLPAKDSFDKLVIRNDVLEKVNLDQEDLEKYKVQSVGGQTKWEPNEDTFEIDFTEAEINYVRETLRGLSDKKELSHQHVRLYDTFVNGKNTVEKKKDKKDKPIPEESPAESPAA